MDTRLHSIKAVYENGVIEDVKEGLIIVKEKDSLRFDAVNLLPVDQILLNAIVLNELVSEYFLDEDPDQTFEMFTSMLKALISSLLNTNNQTKGEVIQ